MARIESTTLHGRPLYWIPDGLGACWAGGWWDQTMAEAVAADGEESGWDADRCPAPDVALNEQARPADLAVAVVAAAKALDPDHQGDHWPDPISWDGRPLDEQADDLLALLEARIEGDAHFFEADILDDLMSARRAIEDGLHLSVPRLGR